MTIADDVAAVLPSFRAEAEALMVDACTVTRSAPGAWDDSTGAYGTATLTTVYTGKCRVRMAWSDGSVNVSGEAKVTLSSPVISFPVATSSDIAIGDRVTVTACPLDESQVGRVYVVRGPHGQTHSTARRLRVEAEDADA